MNLSVLLPSAKAFNLGKSYLVLLSDLEFILFYSIRISNDPV